MNQIETNDPRLSGGILNIHKPSGIGSFDVVKQVRKILGIKKVGHCGTLDPMASGVLVIVFAAATAQVEALMAGDKCYLAEMRLGIKTDTGDMTGNVIATQVVPVLKKQIIQKLFRKFIGEIEQIPPMFSALKHQGQPLYQWARRGIEIVRKPRTIQIYSLELLQNLPSTIEFRVVCSKGTYIRTLVEDMGETLGVPSTLSKLIRERSGDFSIEASIGWNDLIRMSRNDLLDRIHLPAVLAPLQSF